MTVLLLGSSGQLGRALRDERDLTALAWVDADRNPIDDATHPLDMTDSALLVQLLDQVRPAVIINAAAWTAVDSAEVNETDAAQVNATAVGVLGEWARARGALVVHVSTDYVFDGNATRPYLETDPVGPVNAYGRTKLAGEQVLAGSGAAYMVMRTAWLYSAGGPSFLGTILRLAGERDTLRIVANQYGSPTSAPLLARAILRAVALWTKTGEVDRPPLQGIYHVVADGSTSWHGFAQAIVQGAVGRGILRRAPAVEPIPAAEYPTPARRPAYSVLDNSRFKNVFSCDLPGWESLLQETLDHMQPLIRPE